MFNPYVQQPEWPAGIVREFDPNDVPADCRLYSHNLDNRPFREECDEAVELSAMHELYLRGSLRSQRVA